MFVFLDFTWGRAEYFYNFWNGFEWISYPITLANMATWATWLVFFVIFALTLRATFSWHSHDTGAENSADSIAAQ